MWAGECTLVGEAGWTSGTFDIGVVETGRSRVFAGYYAAIVDQNGSSHSAEHPHSLRRAVISVACDELDPAGWTLVAAAMETEEYFESGLSENSGFLWAHSNLSRPIHMMEALPTKADDGLIYYAGGVRRDTTPLTK